MSRGLHTIEVDEATARTLQARARDRGVSVSELIAEFARIESEPVSVDADALAELDRRWKVAEAAGGTISNQKVMAWLKTWGTEKFKPWHEG